MAEHVIKLPDVGEGVAEAELVEQEPSIRREYTPASKNRAR